MSHSENDEEKGTSAAMFEGSGDCTLTLEAIDLLGKNVADFLGLGSLGSSPALPLLSCSVGLGASILSTVKWDMVSVSSGKL